MTFSEVNHGESIYQIHVQTTASKVSLISFDLFLAEK